MKNVYFLSILLTFISLTSWGQTVPFPEGPRDFNEIEPWGHTNKGTNWDTSPYLPFIYQNTTFRFMPPNGVSYDSGTETWTFGQPGATYPLILFFHGAGERGDDNNNQLRHGGRKHRDAVLSGEFPGFLVYPQNRGPEDVLLLIQKIISEFPVDQNRIYVHGLSNGGKWTWQFLMANPTLVAAAAPMSAILNDSYQDYLRFTPIRLAQGGKDKNPAPGFTQTIVDQYDANGGNLEYFFYENLGHGTWNTMYNRSDFFTWFLSQSKNKIHVLFDNREICPGDPVNVTMGFTPGFSNYEWRRDGVLMVGENSSSITVGQFGTYTGRLVIDGQWTDWSEPVVIQEKAPTVTPPIQTNGLRSAVLPALDGSATTELVLPSGFAEYQWENADNSQVLGTSELLTVGVGNYRATVTEFGGCSSNYSDVFAVVDANGANKPDEASNLRVNVQSKTSLQLLWDQNPTPVNDETGFEIYSASAAEGPWTLTAIVGANESTYLHEGLSAGTEYFYQMRAINNDGGSVASNISGAITEFDEEKPTAPTGLSVVGTTSNSVSLSWSASSDNVGVLGYNVYVDGLKSYTTTETSFTVFGLTENEAYTFSVTARDLSENESTFSNQVVSAAVFSGLNYKYYEGTWSVLPDFNALTPVAEGQTPNVDIGVRLQNNNFAFLWEGMINIPVAGDYTFETRSDDGSKLYIGGYDESNLVVDNDGLHGSRYREGTYNFPAPGFYTIVIAFFERGGGQLMEVYWKNTAHGVGESRQLIPSSAFEADFALPGNPPSAPFNLQAVANGYDQITVSWSDSGVNSNGFQIFRATSLEDTFVPVGITGDGVLSFVDTGLNASTTYYYQVVALSEFGPSHEVQSPQEQLGAINRGVAAKDNATGSGYIMFSEENVFNRFSSAPPLNNNSDHLVAIRYSGGGWQYDNNSNYYAFTPLSSDLILAEVDFTNDQITGLEGTNTVVNGLNAGFASGDLTFFADRWNGGNNNGEFTILGTTFTRNTEALASATTDFLPAIPNAPDSLSVSNATTKNIELVWKDNSNDEDYFEIFRSVGDSLNFQLSSEAPAGNDALASALDSGLFAHTTYFYKVRSGNVGGVSAFSNTLEASTQNSVPVTNSVDSVFFHHSETLDITITATDADGDLIFMNPIGFPAFVDFFDDGEGNGLVIIDPSVADVGTYNLQVDVEDNFGGLTQVVIPLEVSNNFKPVIAPFSDVAVREGESMDVVLTASDVDSDTIIWRFDNLPAFVTADVSVANQVTLSIAPGFEDSGVYSIGVTADDNEGGLAAANLGVEILDYVPSFAVYLNFGNSSPAAAPWNNLMTGSPTSGTSFTDMVNDQGFGTGYDVALETNWNGSQVAGGSTAAIYPVEVSRSYFWTNSGAKIVRLSGLSANSAYSFEFFGSRAKTGDRSTVYSIGSLSDTLNASFNDTETAKIEGVFADVNGEIEISVSNINYGGGIFTVGYLNAIVMTVANDGGTVPVAPSALAAIYNTTGHVDLSWTDNSDNETGFEIYRSVGDSLNFQLLATVDANVTALVDSDLPGDEFFYKVRAINFRGESAYAQTVQVSIPNQPPYFNNDSDISVLAGAVESYEIYVLDLENDNLTVQVNNLPAFADHTYDGDSTITINVNPLLSDLGVYPVQIIANDTDGNSAETVVEISVQEKVVQTVLVNFSVSGPSAPAPWNNFTGAPNVGLTYNDLVNTELETTAFDISLQTAWAGGNSNGVVTGDDSGVYPDVVMNTYYADNSTSNKTIRLSGLDITKFYDLSFFSSRAAVIDNRITNFTINGQTQGLNAKENATNVVSFEGVVPDGSGNIDIVVAKAAGSPWAYINAMEIGYYSAPILPGTPSNFNASAVSGTQINLSWTDNSANETGFEIYRSEGGGTFNLLTTVGANVTSYHDTGLLEGSTYGYRVRAINANGTSLFVEDDESTYSRSIYVNIGGATSIAGSPWNNTGNDPFVGNEYPDLDDENGFNTGFKLSIVSNSMGTTFTSSGTKGVVTGNDSGIYPDVVISSYFWIEQGEKASFKFSNLNLSEEYDFVFFGSRTVEFRGTDFTINNETASLDVSFNSQNTVKIEGVRPDVNGEIFIDMESMAGATIAHVGAIVVHGSVTSQPLNSFVRSASGKEESLGAELADYDLRFYPNPFEENATIEFVSGSDETVSLQVINRLGQEVLSQDIEIIKGVNEIPLVSDNWESGVYFVRLLNGQGFNKVLKVIKR